MSLKEWLLNYIKSRQSLDGRIENIEETGEILTVMREKEHIYHICERFKISALSQDRTTIVTISSEENVKAVVANWKTLIGFPKLNIIFVNIESNQKWSIFPSTHDKVTEPAALETGLFSMAREAGLT